MRPGQLAKYTNEPCPGADSEECCAKVSTGRRNIVHKNIGLLARKEFRVLIKRKLTEKM